MPVGFLSDAERQRLDSFPAQIVPGDIETHFTLSRADRRRVPRTASPANRLGFALQLGTLRFLGFCPDDLGTAPVAVVAFVARQLDVAPGELARYGRRGQTRTEHLRQIRHYLGFRKAAAGDLSRLEGWLVDRALEHDRPTLLLRMACEHLRGLKIERPGITHLERLIAAARQRAQHETYRRLAPILTGDCKARLDGLLTVDAATGRSTLAWLQQSVASYTPPTILVTLGEAGFLPAMGDRPLGRVLAVAEPLEVPRPDRPPVHEPGPPTDARAAALPDPRRLPLSDRGRPDR